MTAETLQKDMQSGEGKRKKVCQKKKTYNFHLLSGAPSTSDLAHCDGACVNAIAGGYYADIKAFNVTALNYNIL